MDVVSFLGFKLSPGLANIYQQTKHRTLLAQSMILMQIFDVCYVGCRICIVWLQSILNTESINNLSDISYVIVDNNHLTFCKDILSMVRAKKGIHNAGTSVVYIRKANLFHG